MSKDPKDTDTYDLDIEADTDLDADEAIREAMEAVQAREADRPAEEEVDLEPLNLAEEAEEEVSAEPEDAGTEDLKRELEEEKERSVRLLADFDNYRKRVEREQESSRRYAGEPILRDFLGVVDNLERALEAAGEESNLRTGVELIYKQMIDLLDRRGVRPVEAKGASFDPAVHEAVARLEDESVSEPRVVDELQRGYLLHDRLLRPAMVRVAVPVEGPPDQTSESPSQDDE